MSATDQKFAQTSRGAWVLGTTSFAGVMLVMIGSFQLLAGLAAVFEDAIYVQGISYAYAVDLSTWGWIHTVLGVVAILVGIGILVNNAAANVAGIVIAFLSALSSFAFLPYYPLWSMIIIAFDALVMWALCVQVGRSAD